MIGHEKLKVYQASLQCVGLGVQLTQKLPKGFADLRSQLRRAIFSVSLNIAEGAGRSQKREKQHFYAIARGSAMESAAVCDILHQCNIVDQTLYKQLKSELREVIAMLSSMILTKGK